ncbi:MAG: WYL domain-containing protein [Desulfobulbaceae bacterium]|nr:WYL domain-containing protein [Desulfobulbaceae bacterium]
MKKQRQVYEERLSFVDFCANFLGQVGRSDVANRFGISDAAASKVLAEYIEKRPDNLTYDFKSKKHCPTKVFKPLYQFSVSQILKALSTGFGDIIEGDKEAYITTVVDPVLNRPKINVLSQVSRAINLKRALKVEYDSLSSGINKRAIVPFALVYSGLRWHVRAYDRKRKRFSDFVLSRMKSTELIDGEDILLEETSEFDTSWNSIVVLSLIPHPNIHELEAIEMDYGMENGRLKIKVRAAVAPYILRHWNVDCTNDHSLKGTHYQLYLSNKSELVGIVDFAITPGGSSKL